MMTLPLASAQLSTEARRAITAMIDTGATLHLQFENGKRRVTFRHKGREREVSVDAFDELLRGGLLDDEKDCFPFGGGQSYTPARHAVLKTTLKRTRTDKMTGAKYRAVEVTTTAGMFTAEICIRDEAYGTPLNGSATTAKLYSMITAGQPLLGGAL